ncbi:hypothetical protein [Gordonia aichiensis]|uniref:hypothetical protein n=1 Tax=Gordonia aichiensis TaxID=36820 RepID=UPI00326653DA
MTASSSSTPSAPQALAEANDDGQLAVDEAGELVVTEQVSLGPTGQWLFVHGM